MILISIIIALVIERLGARADYWQISHYANSYLTLSNKQLSKKGLFYSPIGFLIWLMLPVLAIAIVFQLSDSIIWQLAINVVVLLVCFGCSKQRALYKSYLNALTRNDLEAASLYALQIGQKKLEDEPQGETFGQTLAWLNFRFYCAVIFWFVILGVPGAVLYALVRTYADKVRDDHRVIYAKRFNKKSRRSDLYHLLRYYPLVKLFFCEIAEFNCCLFQGSSVSQSFLGYLCGLVVAYMRCQSCHQHK